MQKSIVTFIYALPDGNCIEQEDIWESLKIKNEMDVLFPENNAKTADYEIPITDLT